MDARTPLLPKAGNTKRSVAKRVLNKPEERKTLKTQKTKVGRPKKPGQHGSFIARMLNPASKSAQAQGYTWVISVLIGVNVVCFILSTYASLAEQYGDLFEGIEAATSYVFLLDYALRLAIPAEEKKWRDMSPIGRRLAWALSYDGLLDAMATFPYFLDAFILHDILPSFTWVRIFRIFVIFRTNKYSHAVSTVVRVLFVNREIIGVTFYLVMFMLLFTSALIWATADEELAQLNHIDSVPSAMYLALQMLTGQGGPDGDLTTQMQLVCALTAFLSVPFFAVPAAMLTWGFEGEAERLAEREQRRFQRKKIYDEAECLMMDTSSSSSGDDDAMEEYLGRWGGGDAHEQVEAKALTFFQQPGFGTTCTGRELREKALQKSRQLKQERARGEKQTTLQHDALLLLERVSEADDAEHCSEHREELENTLLHFCEHVQACKADPEDKLPEEDAGPSLSEVMAELKALRKDVARLAGRAAQ